MSISKPCAAALELWLRDQDKFEGATVRTRKLKNGNWEIFEWKVDGVEKPKDKEVENIIKQYENKIIEKQQLEEKIRNKIREIAIKEIEKEKQI